MIPPVLVIRPEPGLAATLARGKKLGLAMVGTPLFAVSPVSWVLPPDLPDALLVGSANAVRHGGPALKALHHLAVYAVGETTANVARRAGFRVRNTGEGGLQALLDALAAERDPPKRLLRLAGADRVPLRVPPPLTLIERVVYKSAALPMPVRLATVLADGAVVLLHSARAAHHFAQECDRLGVDRSRLHLALIGARLRAQTGAGWASTRIADRPNDAALLASAREVCIR